MKDTEIDLGMCPYYARYESLPGHDPKATCTFGCRDEPQCLTCEPDGGWPSRLADVMTADRAAELRRIGQLRHFELLAELHTHLPPRALDDPRYATRHAAMSRDSLISALLPPLHDVKAVAA